MPTLVTFDRLRLKKFMSLSNLILVVKRYKFFFFIKTHAAKPVIYQPVGSLNLTL